MQACGINDVTDFLAESIRNPIKAYLQGLDDRVLLGENFAFLPTFLPTLLPTFLPTLLSQNVCGAHEVVLLFCWNC